MDWISGISQSWARLVGFNTDKDGNIKGFFVVGGFLAGTSCFYHYILKTLLPLPPQPLAIQDPSDDDYEEHERRRREYNRKKTIHWGLVSAFVVATFLAGSKILMEMERLSDKCSVNSVEIQALINKLDRNNAKIENLREKYNDEMEKLIREHSEKLSEQQEKHNRHRNEHIDEMKKLHREHQEEYSKKAIEHKNEISSMSLGHRQKLLECAHVGSSTSYVIVHNDTGAPITVDGHHKWGVLGGAFGKTDSQIIKSGASAVIQGNMNSWGVGRGVSLSVDRNKWVTVDHGRWLKASKIIRESKNS